MRKNYIFAAFIAGAAAGSVAVWFYARTRYERIAREEIDSVKEVFSKRGQEGFGNKEGKRPDMEEYADILQKTGYGDVSEKEEGAAGENDPYVIAPEEFGENEEYDKICLTYYADGILANDNDEKIEDIEGLVGNALDHFGEYEDDSVFVRSDKLGCDYEILMDKRRFCDIIRFSSDFKRGALEK